MGGGGQLIQARSIRAFLERCVQQRYGGKLVGCGQGAGATSSLNGKSR